MNIGIEAPSITISKVQSSGPNPVTATGQVIGYLIDLENTGNVNITGINITELYPGTGTGTLGAPVESVSINGVLNPGERWRYAASYTVTQSDIDAGTNLVNTARVVTLQVPGPLTASATTRVTGTASLAITKVASETAYSAAGIVLHYTITVRNNGNVTLNNILVTDPLTGMNQLIANLGPGAMRTFNTTYTTVQNDLNSGHVDNTATASARHGGTTVTATASESVPASQLPDITITKSATENNYSSPGNIIHYTVTVTNTGNVALNNIQVSDPLTGLNQAISLSPGERRVFNNTYTIVQNDINAGHRDNAARATYSFAGTQHSESASLRIPATQTPSLSITKNASETSYSAVNEILHYTIVVRNTGNVTLANIIVRDNNTGLSQTITSLAPGGAQTFNTAHTVTQDDLNAGHFNNTATASCNYGGTTFIASDDASVPARQNPGLTVTKTVAEPYFSSAGELMHYTIIVRNTGNVTLTNVTIADPNTQLTCSGSPYTMAPNASRTCTATHTVTMNDIINGTIRNTAVATGRDPNNGTVTGSSNTVILSLNNIAPSIRCPAPIRTSTGSATCNALINNGLSASFSDPNDNIASLTWIMRGATTASSPVTGINNLGSYTFNRGITTITYTVTDRMGLSASCSFTVEVYDNILPVVRCLPLQDRNTDLTGPYYTVAGTEFDPVSVWDNCTISGVTNNINNSQTLAGERFPIGETNVIWTVTDNSGNASTCSFIVRVTDNVPPVARCKDITVLLDLITGLYRLTAEEINNGSFDNSGIADMRIDVTNFDCSLLGSNRVTLSVTDIYGNTGNCTATVTVMYQVPPQAEAKSDRQVICNGESTNIILTNSIPNTTWTWNANSTQAISGTSSDNTGGKTSIIQRLSNSDTLVHEAVYTILPKVYGKCDLPEINSSVWVNPVPAIRVHTDDTIICNGGTANISIRNPNTIVRGRWKYNLTVLPDEAIAGSSNGGSFSEATGISETLINNDKQLRKVVYRFTPEITLDDSLHSCSGPAEEITIWIRPAIAYLKRLSYFNGFNISCYNRSDGYIMIVPSSGSVPLTYSWQGPNGFVSTGDYLRSLVAGKYDLLVTDRNNCTVEDSVILRQPSRLTLKVETSVSMDGAYNINCASEKTGSIVASAINFVENVRYVWNDGIQGNMRTGLSAGNYKVIISDANNCLSDSTVTLTEPELLKTEIEITQPFCPEKPDGAVKVKTTGGVHGNDYTYRWSDNSTASSLTNIPAGSYSVVVKDLNGCSLEASAEVAAQNEICLIIPEAISPNNDMVNDVWNIGNTDMYPRMEILIYNRWMQLLWKSEEGYPHPWDGKSNGKVLPMDSYHYVIDLHNGRKPFMGSITIVK
jgi:gliding motility-associated-like protein/uncharacterized repeat protein (TIGR01451 family)